VQIGAALGRHAHRAFAAATLVALSIVQTAAMGRPASGGSISGRVVLTARVRGAALPTNAYLPRAVSLPAASNEQSELRNVVLYLKNAAYAGVLPAMHRQIRQEYEAFVPRVVAVTRGSVVDFPNGDPFFHNVFSLSAASTFDLGRYPDTHSRSRQFTKAGLVKVYCHIHSQMSASILVLDHPYFAMPDDAGGFVLPGVPEGEYSLVAWHERVGQQVSKVIVQAGQASTVEIKLPVVEPR
jgi:plastocyanin